ncbi:MAG TPA: hypothetical protein DCG57_07475 [Candidatus Riflebacteria bacterium]|jgi:SAM-dependent methyltransferase|nr:hypothetical protein [Candidatus Riflebacteria bacterium]
MTKANHKKIDSTPDEILSNYTGEAGMRYQNIANAVSKEAFALVSLARRDKLQKYVKASDVVFEYGVGTGWNLSGLECRRRLGYDVCDHLEKNVTSNGIEYISHAAKVADGSIDVVICHHVLEHLSDPVAALHCMRRILKPGGRLLLFVPSEHEIRFRRFVASDPNHHIFSWSCQSLGNLVSNCAFKVKICREQTFGYEKLASTVTAKLQCGRRLFRLLRQLFHLVRHDKEIFLLAESPIIHSPDLAGPVI